LRRDEMILAPTKGKAPILVKRRKGSQDTRIWGARSRKKGKKKRMWLQKTVNEKNKEKSQVKGGETKA